MRNNNKNIRIEWECRWPGKNAKPGLKEAWEKVCTEAANLNGWEVVRIVQYNRNKKKVTVEGEVKRLVSDVYAQVMVGFHDRLNMRTCTGHGRIYATVDENGYPVALVPISQLKVVDTNQNPEIWGPSKGRKECKLTNTRGYE